MRTIIYMHTSLLYGLKSSLRQTMFLLKTIQNTINIVARNIRVIIKPVLSLGLMSCHQRTPVFLPNRHKNGHKDTLSQENSLFYFITVISYLELPMLKKF